MKTITTGEAKGLIKSILWSLKDNGDNEIGNKTMRGQIAHMIKSLRIPEGGDYQISDSATVDEYVLEYVCAALFSSTDNDGDPLDSTKTIADISPETLASMARDCHEFRDENAGVEGILSDLSARDFWYTRNGHGCGFWDGDWPEDVGDKLAKSAKSFGGFDLYVGDDGKIYHQ